MGRPPNGDSATPPLCSVPSEKCSSISVNRVPLLVGELPFQFSIIIFYNSTYFCLLCGICWGGGDGGKVPNFRVSFGSAVAVQFMVAIRS